MDKNNLKIKNVDTISNTMSSLMQQKGGYLDITSSFIPQKGGYLNNNKNEDINHLISMLSATSDSNYTTNSTNTEEIKNKLSNILQDGGGKKDYDELIDTFTKFNTIAILSNVKKDEDMENILYITDEKNNEYCDKIIKILNSSKLEKNDVQKFLLELKNNFILHRNNNLTKHPILILIYARIINEILYISKYNLEEIARSIIVLLYNKINEIFGSYLIKNKEEIYKLKAEMSKPYELQSFYNMLQNISNNIENYLIKYLTTLLLPEASESSKAPLRLSSAPAAYTGQDQHRSLTPSRLSPRLSPRSSTLTSSLSSSRLSGSPASSRSLSEQLLLQSLSQPLSQPPSSIQQRSALSSSRSSALTSSRSSALTSSRLSGSPASSRLSGSPASSRSLSEQPLSQPLSSIQPRSALSSSRLSAPYTELRPPLSQQRSALSSSRLSAPSSSRLSAPYTELRPPLSQQRSALLSSRLSAPSSSRLSDSSPIITKYNWQIEQLDIMKNKDIITGSEYFNTKLAISHDLSVQGIKINISKSIMDAINTHQILDGITYYRDPTNEGKLFWIFPSKHKRKGELIGPIFEREYYKEVY
jgi:hypothetical protein